MNATDYVYKYWFPRNFSEEIYIVCPKDSSSTYDANMWSDDYAYLDSFGDKDLLFLVYGFICKHYPQAKVHYSFSSQYKNEHPNDWKQKNLIILGGASWHHEVTRTFMHKALRGIYKETTQIDRPPVLYSIKSNGTGWQQVRQEVCEGCSMFEAECRENHSLCIWAGTSDITKPTFKSIERKITREIKALTPVKLQEKVDEVRRHLSENQQQRLYEDSDGRFWISDCISKDIGIFAAYQNPYNKKNRVIMINGAHTFGGVGAFRTFDVDKDNEIALQNYELLASVLGDESNDFIAYFPVEVDDTALICDQCTQLTKENIISLCIEGSKIEQPAEYNEVDELSNQLIDFKKDLEPFTRIAFDADEIDKNLCEIATSIIAKISDILDKLSKTVYKSQLKQYSQEFHALQKEWNQARGVE